MKHVFLKSLALSALLVGSASAATAETAEQFYNGKTVEIYIGYGLGGTYGKSATIMGEHLKPRLGADAVIVKSMPGAGGLKMTNYYANVAPKDGSAIMLPPDTLVITQLLKPKKAKYDARNFTWLGSSVRSNSFVAVRSDTGVKTWKDLLTKEVPFAASGLGSQTYQIPSLINGLLGTKIKIVKGYKGSRKMLLAMEQGEVGGINLTWLAYKTNRQSWVKKGFARGLIQMGPVAEKDHPNLPLLMNLVKKEDRPLVTFMSSLISIGRSLAVSKAVPSDRKQFLKAAFSDMAQDPKFAADMKKRKLEVTYTSAADVQKVVNESLSMPSNIIKRTNKILFGRGS
ncbi:MAG: tripartite tricarboxylate transporter substrate-binding protein [Pseudomonadota bacterium]|nr:tripartite tricarboxylate transporter substrate-binding protein [Pseudomonadota bacterium]